MKVGEEARARKFSPDMSGWPDECDVLYKLQGAGEERHCGPKEGQGVSQSNQNKPRRPSEESVPRRERAESKFMVKVGAGR
jgi:hypothetical protein